MDKKIIVFSGMPASGKDTVTERLCGQYEGFAAFKKHRAVGPQDKLKDTYFNISKEEFERKIASGDFLQYHGRYGRYYGIEADTLLGYFEEGKTPIIHIGRIENYYALLEGLKSFEEKQGIRVQPVHIQLWETKEALTERIMSRSEPIEEKQKRVKAMEQEFEDAAELLKSGKRPFTCVIRNTGLEETCRRIAALAEGDESGDDGYEELEAYLKGVQEQ